MFRPGAPESHPRIEAPAAAADVLLPLIGSLDREHAVLLSLSTKHKLIATTTLSIGTVDRTFFAPREVFLDAIRHGAAAIILGHNHPSGDPEPSVDDVAITRRIARAGELLGIPLLDHLVIGDEQWVSLAQQDALE